MHVAEAIYVFSFVVALFFSTEPLRSSSSFLGFSFPSAALRLAVMSMFSPASMSVSISVSSSRTTRHLATVSSGPTLGLRPNSLEVASVSRTTLAKTLSCTSPRLELSFPFSLLPPSSFLSGTRCSIHPSGTRCAMSSFSCSLLLPRS